MSPVSVHAGGIVWSGDRVLVAATDDGVREFRLSGILKRGRRHLLPQVAHHKPSEPFRFSFIAEGSHGIVTGEYTTRNSGRLAGVTVGDGVVSVGDIHSPVVPEMQGALLIDDLWAVTSGRGDKQNGDLWVGNRGALVRHEGALPPGPEDLAWWPDRHQVWGATEHPGQRFVYAVDWPVA